MIFAGCWHDFCLIFDNYQPDLQGFLFGRLCGPRRACQGTRSLRARGRNPGLGLQKRGFWEGFTEAPKNPELGVPHRFLKIRDAHSLLERGVQIQAWSSNQFRTNFGPISGQFWTNFGPFSQFRPIFGPMSDQFRTAFGPIFGPFRTNLLSDQFRTK